MFRAAPAATPDLLKRTMDAGRGTTGYPAQQSASDLARHQPAFARPESPIIPIAFVRIGFDADRRWEPEATCRPILAGVRFGNSAGGDVLQRSRLVPEAFLEPKAP